MSCGVAILAMIAYHFFFDLEFFGLANVGLLEQHWGWTAFVRTIPASFLTIAGISLYIAHGNGIRWRAFWWRFGILVAAAMLITVVSYFTDPEAMIWFGILHCIAVSSLIGLAFLRAPLIIVLAAAVLALIGPWFATPALNAPALLFLGLGSEEPPSNDYNPLFPWLAFLLLGIALARVLRPYAANAAWTKWRPDHAPSRLLAAAGRHSLIIYLLHQPILMGLLFGIARIAT
jgi:uncharacterized membrane protein